MKVVLSNKSRLAALLIVMIWLGACTPIRVEVYHEFSDSCVPNVQVASAIRKKSGVSFFGTNKFGAIVHAVHNASENCCGLFIISSVNNLTIIPTLAIDGDYFLRDESGVYLIQPKDTEKNLKIYNDFMERNEGHISNETRERIERIIINY